MENIPQKVSDEVVEVLHEKLFWNGFTMQDPIDNDDFYVIDGPDSDLYCYRNTKLIELRQKADGNYDIQEYL